MIKYELKIFIYNTQAYNRFMLIHVRNCCETDAMTIYFELICRIIIYCSFSLI